MSSPAPPRSVFAPASPSRSFAKTGSGRLAGAASEKLFAAPRAARLLGEKLAWTAEEERDQVTKFVTAIDRELSTALTSA